MNHERWLETRRGALIRVLQGGPPDGPPLIFLHGLTGLLDDTFLDLLAERHRVLAPELPGYGDSSGEELLDDMLDFSLHGWDVLDGLGLIGRRPALVGHSLGGMIAAEMTCLAPAAIGKLVLADPDSLREFFIGNARRLGTAGKILFPIPNRRLSKRLYRLTTDTLVVWAENDRLMPPVYAAQWQALLPKSHTVCLAGAGHMLPYEQPQALAREVLAFLA
jgi:pimeloyl-ACP methyl ester carboxylesterase